MEISVSTYHYKPKVDRKQRAMDETAVCDMIEKIRLTHHTCGYRTLMPYLKQEGLLIGETRLRRIMRENSLQAKVRRAFTRTTNSNHGYRYFPNLIRGKEVRNLNQVWVADITYIRVLTGFIYLAAIMDLYSRKIVGWALSRNIDADLCLDALTMAIKRRKPAVGTIHHSDRGVQYLCNKYVALLQASGFEISNSARGNPYENAFIESFNKTLKVNEVYLAHYDSMAQVFEDVPRFIEEVYNEKRVHSGIDYQTPNAFERNLEKGQNNDRYTLKLW
jgi:transposase InsO family protein